MPNPAHFNRPKLSDHRALHDQACHNMEEGAVTPSYQANREAIIAQLNAALATEYVCSLRYYQHYYAAKGMFAAVVKGEFLEHAEEEKEHAHMIAERIVQLGGVPDFNPDTFCKRSHAEFQCSSCIHAMMKEDLISERIAIDTYREMIAFVGHKDSTTRRLLEKILAQEEEHADEFADLLEGWQSNNSCHCAQQKT